jgi:putative transposase
MSHSYSYLLSHLVFSTKERRPCLDAELQPRVFAYLGGIIRELGGKALMVGGMPDHVHLLLSLSPTHAPADVVRVAKANSSRWVHETWPGHADFAWQTGYGIFSVSRSNQDAVLAYIANQAEHHARQTFQEEFVSLLNKHGVEYDERFIWG